jgi:hypothetical protein
MFFKNTNFCRYTFKIEIKIDPTLGVVHCCVFPVGTTRNTREQNQQSNKEKQQERNANIPARNTGHTQQ